MRFEPDRDASLFACADHRAQRLDKPLGRLRPVVQGVRRISTLGGHASGATNNRAGSKLPGDEQSITEKLRRFEPPIRVWMDKTGAEPPRMDDLNIAGGEHIPCS